MPVSEQMPRALDHGPVFLLGVYVLVDAFWAMVGDDSFGDVLGVLQPVLEDAVPGLDGQVAGDALIGAFAVHYDCGQPDNAAVMARITSRGGNVLENLVAAGAVHAESPCGWLERQHRRRAT